MPNRRFCVVLSSARAQGLETPRPRVSRALLVPAPASRSPRAFLRTPLNRVCCRLQWRWLCDLLKTYFDFFQKHIEVPGTVHYIGRIVVGVCGITYCTLQTIITFYLSKLQINTVKLFVLRIVTSSLLCVSGFVHVIMDVWLAIRLLKGNAHIYKTWYFLKSTDAETYFTDIISDISEWLTFLLFALFASTYFQEFRDLGVEMTAEMNCFSKDYFGRKPRKRENSRLKYHRESESSESSDQDWTLHILADFQMSVTVQRKCCFLITWNLKWTVLFCCPTNLWAYWKR